MNERDVARARQNEAEFHSYVQSVAVDTPSTADQLTKLADLKAKGVLTDAEYEQQKAKLLELATEIAGPSPGESSDGREGGQ